jgi:hypothetical protein
VDWESLRGIDHDGCLMSSKCLTKMRNLEHVAAEALIALHAAEFCRDLGLKKDYPEKWCASNSEHC